MRILFSLLVLMLCVAGAANADERPTHVENWKMGMVEAASPIKEMMHHFHDELLVIITVISIFVLILLMIIGVRFNRKSNPEASKTTHNTLIEVVWTTVPIIILIAIAIPSFKLLYYMDRSPDTYRDIRVENGVVYIGKDGETFDGKVTVNGDVIENGIVVSDGQARMDGEIRLGRTVIEVDANNRTYPEMTLKVVGNAWFWQYEYPDQGIPVFDSNILSDEELTPEKPYRLLEVDNRVVLPVDTNIRVQVTAADVIHAWAVPAFGIKMDAVPGRLNETWVRITRPGVYYGQCSELCGVRHGFMPIAIEAVSREQFILWAERAKAQYSENGTIPSVSQTHVAASN